MNARQIVLLVALVLGAQASHAADTFLRQSPGAGQPSDIDVWRKGEDRSGPPESTAPQNQFAHLRGFG
jgi:hypothetical protein